MNSHDHRHLITDKYVDTIRPPLGKACGTRSKGWLALVPQPSTLSISLRSNQAIGRSLLITLFHYKADLPVSEISTDIPDRYSL